MINQDQTGFEIGMDLVVCRGCHFQLKYSLKLHKCPYFIEHPGKAQKEDDDNLHLEGGKVGSQSRGLGSCHHLSTTPKVMNFSLNSDV